LIFSLFLVIQLVFLLSFVNKKFLLLSGAILLTVFLVYTAFSVEKIFIILALYISCFEVVGYLHNFPGLPLLYDWKISYPLFSLLLIYWIIHLLTNREDYQWKKMDTAVAVFVVLIAISILRGFIQGHEAKKIFADGSSLPFYLAYFVFLYSGLRYRVKSFYDLLLLFSILVSLQFFYAVAHFKSIFVLQRIVSRHIHLAQFAIPYIMLTLIYSTSRRRRITFACLLPFPILAVLFSQQRSLYGSTALAIVFLLGVYLYVRRRWIRKNLFKFTSIIAGILTFLIVTFLVLQVATGGKFLLTIYSRFYIFLNVQYLGFDLSWRIRWREIQYIFRNLGDFWLFGQGVGAFSISRGRYELQFSVDNAYAYLIWKAGILCLISFLYMHFLFFKRGIAMLKKKITSDERILILTALVNTAGLMIIAISNSSIARYRLMFIWAALFACVEVLARKYD
jgi:hypothetical protein